MKRTASIVIAILLAIPLFAQERVLVSKEQRTIAEAKPPSTTSILDPSQKLPGSASESLDDALIGETFYDLQSNSGMQNRIYAHADGTVGAVYTMGFDYPPFPDRGTGYNYFDGSGWGVSPTVAIEDERTGWPSYAPWGENGEIVVAHYSGASTEGLVISSRVEKGVGDWTGIDFYGPDASHSYIWPRSATGGVDNSDLHILALTLPVSNGGSIYEGMDGALLYSRSPNGGQTWDYEHVLLDGINSDFYMGFSSDSYEIQAKGDLVAIVAGDEWTGLVLMKSTDKGETWEKTVIWEHPYPLLDPNGSATTEIYYNADGSHCLAFDASGKVHVAFGISRSYVDTGQYYWFPEVDGVGYWNEDMPAFSNDLNALSPYGDPGSELIEDYNLIGWSQDINGNGELDLLDDWGQYYCGLSSMPQLVIDDWNRVYLVYSSVTEMYDNGEQNYRHIWARASADGGESWGNFVDLTEDLIYIFSECVFPSCSQRSDDMIYLLFQEDSEPGMAVRGDEDPYGDNNIVFMSIYKEEPIGDMGHLAGIVADDDTGLPIENATVEMAGTGYSATTQPDGSYLITIGTGTFIVACSAMGYYNSDGSAEITMGDTTFLDFQLEPATGLNPPQNLEVSINGTAAVLAWDPPSAGNPVEYNIYKDNALIATTGQLTYVDVMAEPGTYEYFVTAVYWNGESGPSNIVVLTGPPEPCEDFDDLVAGEGVIEQLGGYWVFASSAPGQYDATVVNDNFHSPPNAFEVSDGAGIVFQLGDEAIENGSWEYSHYMYVPSGVPGYFSVHTDPNPSVGWILEVYFNEDGSGFFAGSSSASFSYNLNAWFLVRIILDLDNELGRVYFDQDLIEEFEYTGSLGSIQFWGNNQWGDPGAYFDDVCFGESDPISSFEPPTGLQTSFNGSAIELSWNAPGGGKDKVNLKNFTKINSSFPADKDPMAKMSPIPSDEMFDLLFNFMPQGEGEAGIETDGNYIYTASWNGSGLYKYDQDGNLVGTVPMAGLMIRDMATNGTYFYAGAASTTMFEFDPETGTIISTFTAPVNIRGLAYDDEEDVFYANNWSDDIVKFDMSGAMLGSFPVGPNGGSYYGMAIDNFGNEKYLWAYGQTGETLNELVQIELPSGNETGVYFDVGSLINPGGTGVAGGLASDDQFVPGHDALIGCMQGISLWGVDLDSDYEFIGYNIYHQLNNGPFSFLDFTTDTSYLHQVSWYDDHCYYVTALYQEGESGPSNIECEVISSIAHQTEAPIKLFPNPASELVMIESDMRVSGIVIFNMNGELLDRKTMNGNSFALDVRHYQAGVYYIRLMAAEKIFTRKLVIN